MKKSAPQVKLEFGMETMEVIQNMNFSEERAFAELIDNSIQSYLDNKRPLKKNNHNYKLIIEIITERDIITVKDNAGGIHNKDWARAFKTGRINPDKKSKNEFGIGMKYAAIWMSPYWSLFTKAIGEDFTKSVLVDQKNMVKKNINNLEPHTSVSKTKKTFTYIILKNVHHPINSITPRIINTLSSVFRNYVNNKDIVIKIGTKKKTEIIKWEHPPLMKQISVKDFLYNKSKPKKILWKINVKFTFGISKKFKVDGWVGILDKGDTTKKYSGLFYFRKGRCIYLNQTPQIIFGKSANNFKMQRITGELFFDNNIPISNDKSKFLWKAEDENDFYRKLLSNIEKNKIDLLDQAEKWRKEWLTKKDDKKNKSNHSIDKNLEEANKESVATLENDPDIKKDPQKVLINSNYDDVIKFERINYNGKAWSIRVIKHYGNDTKDWLIIDDPKLDPKNIQITLKMAMNHNFIRTYFRDEKSLEGILHLACYIVLAEISARRYLDSKNPALVRQNINKILNNIPPEKPKIKLVS